MTSKQRRIAPNPGLLECPEVPLSLHSTIREKGSKITICLFLFLNRESRLFYQQCNARDIENSKLIGHNMTSAMSISCSRSNRSSLPLYQTLVTHRPLPIRDFSVCSSPSVLITMCFPSWRLIVFNNLWSLMIRGNACVRVQLRVGSNIIIHFLYILLLLIWHMYLYIIHC